jgi:hypothetical protein
VSPKPRRPFDPASRQVSEWTRVMWEELGDGQWHRRDSIVAAGSLCVAPGRAFRRATRGRGASSTVHGQDDPIRRAVVISAGKRAIALAALRGLIRTGRVEQRAISPGIIRETDFEVRRTDL